MLFLENKIKDSVWGIWKIEETKEELLSQLENISLLEENILSIKSLPRLLEKLAVRVLLKKIIGEEAIITYDELGAPYIENDKRNVSISHTKGYVAVILSPQKYLGIDIQYITEKVKNVRSRFVSKQEYIMPDNELNHLLLHWAAKETMFKACRKRGVFLNKDFIVHKFTPALSGKFTCIDYLTNPHKDIEMNYMITPEFVLTHL